MNEEEVKDLIRAAVIELRELGNQIEIDEKERDLDTIIREYPEILIWKESFLREKERKRKINQNRIARCLSINQDFGILMVKHHVNDWDVVHISKDIHQTIKHKRGDGKLEGVIG